MDIVKYIRSMIDAATIDAKHEVFWMEISAPRAKEAADEIERLREALHKIAESEIEINSAQAYAYCVFVAEAALQQKESE